MLRFRFSMCSGPASGAERLVSGVTATLSSAREIAAGEPLARALCVLLIAFWSLRVIAMAFIFDVRPYLTHWFYRLGYHAINLVFIYLLAVYVFAAWKGGKF